MRPSALRTFLFAQAPLLLAWYTATTSHLAFDNWWAELLTFGLPIVLALSLVVLLLLPIVRPPWPYWTMPAVLFLVTMKPMRETFVPAPPPVATGHRLSVMSFNAALFNPGRPHTLDSRPELYHRFYDHLRAGHVADVLCIQEFFHSGQAEEEMAADSILRLGGYAHFYANPGFDPKYQGMVGAAIFSRFPVTDAGKIDLQGSLYDGCWADLQVDGGTVRVLNFQLRSMSIRPMWTARMPVVANVVFNLLNIHERLRTGHAARRVDLRTIAALLAAGPHPVIICTDLNALPYSSTYQRIKRTHANAFETAGSGFGFTYRQFPWFIRIDHQFFSPRLEAVWARTRRDIHVSDHYPIEAGYRLEGPSGR
ncbi:MAG: endonuclease/exonuclease/phosphatase family protein [Flavobacteriales bacterium]|jgi:endonuclease/exonuclease/phosphatase family metal-dependent hydrolase|nr:endonuclease/exonuclease/phosphatase family protein [Flavobacteriales bacterium]